MNKTYTLLFFSLILLLSSCSDIFEEDLDGKKVTLLSPENGLNTSESPITFLWEKVEGATEYNIQIATPSFSSIRQIILDSSVTATKHTIALLPGTYEWRVKAVNNSSETGFSSYSITIDSTLNLQNKYVILTHPEINDTTNNPIYQIRWNALYGATSYLVQIFQGNNNLYSYKITTDLYYTDTLIDGNFKVIVLGQNSFSTSQYREKIIVVDQILPSKPFLTTPINNAIINDTNVTFVWSNVTDNGTPITYFLNVYSDSLMSNQITPEIATRNNTYPVSFNSNSVFWWGVYAKDAAGNTSNFSGLRKFTLQ